MSRHQECLKASRSNTITGVLGSVRKVAFVAGVIAAALAVLLGWQFASCEIANSQLQEDLRDVASQNAARLGLSPASTDEDFRKTVVLKANEHGIHLEPDRVIVQRTGTEDAPAVNLAADYTASIGFAGIGFTLHFNPRAEGKPLERVRDAR
jgi:hypothetical protein